MNRETLNTLRILGTVHGLGLGMVVPPEVTAQARDLELRAQCRELGAILHGDESTAELQRIREYYAAGKHLPRPDAKRAARMIALSEANADPAKRRVEKNKRKRERRTQRGKR